jgi:hypothetical protein
MRPATQAAAPSMAWDHRRMSDLATVAPAFVEMAHRIVWCVAATTGTDGAPNTRILHPIWEWDGETLRGWIATSPLSLKAKHLARTPIMSLTYWRPNHDTCTVRCRTAWDDTEAGREALWERFSSAPAPLGYVPSIIPAWTSPGAPAFGALELDPVAIRLMEGSKMADGEGLLLEWRAD